MRPTWLIEGVYGYEAEPLLAEVRQQGRGGMVEINGSWLYQCDLAAVVAEAVRLATRAWARERE